MQNKQVGNDITASTPQRLVSMYSEWHQLATVE